MTIINWFLGLKPWLQLVLEGVGLGVITFCCVAVWERIEDWRAASQHEQDRRAFVTRFRNGGPDEID
jgi:hypothetical protein